MNNKKMTNEEVRKNPGFALECHAHKLTPEQIDYCVKKNTYRALRYCSDKLTPEQFEYCVKAHLKNRKTLGK